MSRAGLMVSWLVSLVCLAIILIAIVIWSERGVKRKTAVQTEIDRVAGEVCRKEGEEHVMIFEGEPHRFRCHIEATTQP